MEVDILAPMKAIKHESQFVEKALSEVSKGCCGPTRNARGYSNGIAHRGTCAIGRVPGLAKTLTISSVS